MLQKSHYSIVLTWGYQSPHRAKSNYIKVPQKKKPTDMYTVDKKLTYRSRALGSDHSLTADKALGSLCSVWTH